MAKEYLKPEQVTPEIIAGWKTQYGNCFKYVSADGKVGYFRNPDLAIIDNASSMMANSPVKSNISIAVNCFLAGDKELIEDTQYQFGLASKVAAIIKKVEGEFTEL
jgi:hypothetical protein